MVRWVLDTGPIQDEGSKDASGPPGGLAFLEYHIAKPAKVLVWEMPKVKDFWRISSVHLICTSYLSSITALLSNRE